MQRRRVFRTNLRPGKTSTSTKYFLGLALLVFALRLPDLDAICNWLSQEWLSYSVHPSESFASVDGLAFFDEDFFDFAAFGRLDFVLHFHRFDYDNSLASLNRIAFRHQNPHNFAGHRRDD